MPNKKKGRAWGENGFEDWGGYMAAKRAKLEEQFRDTASKEFQESSKLFEGIAIFVNGYTNPTSDELRRLMMMHGGVFHHYMRPKITTHIIASNLPYSKIMLYKKSQSPMPICKPEWITDSISAGKILNFQNYLLYSNSTNVQPRLVFKSNGLNNEDNTESLMHDEQDVKEEIPVKINDNKSDINNRDILKHGRINNACKHNTNSGVHDTNIKLNAQSTKDSEFLSAFYSNSRLHYIATMGTTFKNYVNELRDKSSGVFHGLERLMKLKQARDPSALSNYESDSEDESITCFKDYNKAGQKKESVIMHIDMDCFFVSVGIRNKPELQGLPVAVAHAKGNRFSMNYDGKEELGSSSEIASCSYAARKAGVKNGMFLGEALKMCSNLKTIQYDFEGYKEVSYILYNTVASYTLDIEAVSCDEMYADCTKILEMSGLSPLEFATIIREEIKQKTNCPVSTGFGNNKLQSRLATRKAKPDGQFYLNSKCAETYIRSFNVRDLPGVGGTTAHKLKEINVRTCEELEKISMGILQKEFGRKMGEQLYKICRGIDDTKLNLEHVRKSVSAEINYGIRFQNNNDAVDFLKKLSIEVCNRLTAAHAKGRCITLKLMIRAEEASKEPAKFMGHGLCNFLTRSKNLIAAIDDVNIIEKEVISIWNQLSLIPEDMRGIGIQVSRLEISKNKQNKASLTNFFNKMEKSHTCDKIKNFSNNEQFDSHFTISEKLDSHKVPVTMKSLLQTKDTSAVKINNISPESAQFFETANVRNNRHKMPIVQRDTHIEQPMVEVNSEKSHDHKSNENIHVTKQKNISGKSNKNVIQTQTSQEKFFKHTKPNRRKSSKYEVPQLQDIDLSVLAELPEDIRSEIFNEYKINKEPSSLNIAANATTIHTNNACKSEMPHNDLNLQESCSQIDVDVLAALMESDLHPDVRRDVQIYCNIKKEANELNLKKINQPRLTENLQKVCLSSAYHDNDKNVKSNTSKNHVKKSIHVSQGDTMTCINEQLYQKDDIDRAKFTTHKISNVLHNNAALDKVDTFIVQNLNTLHNNENIDKHQEMLINLVNHLFTLPLQQVKMQIQTWVAKSKIVNEVDFLSLVTFLSMLPQKKRIEDLHILLKTMHRCTTKTGDCIWHRTYRKTVKHVQRYMQIEYNSNLMVPSIRCNDLRCNNGD